MSAAVAHDPRLLLALDIAVDARHPGSDLVHQQTLAQRQDVIGPLLLEPHGADAAYVDPVEGAGDGVEAGRVDDDVERALAVSSPNAARGDALDRRLVDVDQLDVRLVVDVVVSAFEGYPTCPEAV